MQMHELFKSGYNIKKRIYQRKLVSTIKNPKNNFTSKLPIKNLPTFCQLQRHTISLPDTILLQRQKHY